MIWPGFIEPTAMAVVLRGKHQVIVSLLAGEGLCLTWAHCRGLLLANHLADDVVSLAPFDHQVAKASGSF